MGGAVHIKAAAVSLTSSACASDVTPLQRSRLMKFSRIGDVMRFLDEQNLKNVIVVFDIDYVLIRPTDPFSRSKGQIICQRLLDQDKRWSDPLAKQRIVELMMKETQYELIDPEVPQFLNKLKESDAKVMALTRMAMGIKSQDTLKWRIQQLEDLGLDFSWTESSNKRFDWSESACYEKGVLRAGRKSKGDVLMRFLREMGEKEKRDIIFVDNNYPYLLSVRQECMKQGFNFTGLHFVDESLLSDPLPNSSVINMQLQILDKTQKLMSYDSVLNMIDDLDQVVQQTREISDESISIAWFNVVSYSSNEERDFLSVSAYSGNPLAQAYYAILLYGGIGGADRDLRECENLFHLCFDKILQSEHKPHYKCVLGHLRKCGMIRRFGSPVPFQDAELAPAATGMVRENSRETPDIINAELPLVLEGRTDSFGSDKLWCLNDGSQDSIASTPPSVDFPFWEDSNYFSAPQSQ